MVAVGGTGMHILDTSHVSFSAAYALLGVAEVFQLQSSLTLDEISSAAEPWPKLLFICSVNKLRSRTAEELFRGRQGYFVRSRGTEPDARVRVTAGDLGWADLIFVMEKRHRDRLRQKYRAELEGKRVICLQIPDEYGFMEPALVELLKARLRPHLTHWPWDDA